ncbi:MAG TPA: glycosyltransferase, partial [Anaerolineales bacterium]|nr:glycosyltransferase [Anaerolineales bacterium]
RVIDEVLKAHRRKPLSLFLSYFYNAHFDPSGFAEIRKLGIPTVNFYCNSIYQFDLVAAIAPCVDFSWHAEKHARDSYLKVGSTPIWVQMGADPSVYHPVAGATRESKACFVGMRYADRDRWMTHLVRSGVPISIYGPGWERSNGQSKIRQDGPLTSLGRKRYPPRSFRSYYGSAVLNVKSAGLVGGILRTSNQIKYRNETLRISPILHPFANAGISSDKIADLFAKFAVVLNFSNVWADGRPGSPLIPHVRLRDFEGPMCRTCYLTGHSDEITEFYKIGEEIDTYRTPEELVDKTEFYLSHPTEAERLRESGYRRAIQDHTWAQRFRQLFRLIGLRN